MIQRLILIVCILVSIIACNFNNKSGEDKNSRPRPMTEAQINRQKVIRDSLKALGEKVTK